jgi:hypothetical protein
MTNAPPTASRAQDLPGMPLAELRKYRETLRGEEDNVSYWRRVLYGRIDLLRKIAERRATGEHPGWLVGTDELASALKDTATGRSRLAFMRIESASDLPELPGLDEVWARDADPTDPQEVAEVLAALDEAAARVTAYRGQIHIRIDEATIELVSRYKNDPDACLDLID